MVGVVAARSSCASGHVHLRSAATPATSALQCCHTANLLCLVLSPRQVLLADKRTAAGAVNIKTNEEKMKVGRSIT